MSSQVRVDVDVLPVVSYAMAHNRVPVVQHLMLHNRGPEVAGAEVSASIGDSEGRLSMPWSTKVDLPAEGATPIADVDLRLDPTPMHQVNEQRPGAITIEVRKDGDLLATTTADVQVLASHQWLAQPPELSMELLAAHVMPNAPEVQMLLSEASRLLEKATGSGAIEGYQNGPARADEIATAIYTALQQRHIQYAMPPASWADLGQKVRTPEEVLTGKVGTCLDLCVVIAATFEQAGLRPLIWLVDGHAFLGYWRDEMSLFSVTQSDVTDVVNRIDLDHLRLIETTMVTAQDPPQPFAATHRPPADTYLTGDMERVMGVVDIWNARRNQILPLPAVSRVGGEVTVVEYRPADHSTPPAQPAEAPAEPRRQAVQATAVPPRVQQWKNALLDLSLRNRLINFSARQALHLVTPPDSLGAIENALHSGRRLTILPSDQFDAVHQARVGAIQARDLPPQVLLDRLVSDRTLYGDLTSAAYLGRLRALANKARTIVDETGSNNLYLTLGKLVWSHEGKALRSPLILLPLMLRPGRGHNGAYTIELDESGISAPNYCLYEKIWQLHGVRLPEPEKDDAGINIDEALARIRTALTAAALPFRVEEQADVAVLQFAKFRLWKDLDEGWEVLLQQPLARHLAHTPTLAFADPVAAPTSVDLDELAAQCPVAADASQLEAIAQAVHGRTFVLEGPPGTGKSQTITNLLCRAMAEGKRVLFVAEKRAALDVVQRRLRTAGMEPLSLELHDRAAKPAVVRAQIQQALDLRTPVDHQGLTARTNDLRTGAGVLRRYATRLHEENGAGLSVYSATTQRLAVSSDSPALPVPAHVLGQQASIDQVRATLRTLPTVADPARPSAQHPWRFAKRNGATEVDLAQVRECAMSIDGALAGLRPDGVLAATVAAASTADELGAVDALARSPIPLEVLDETRSDRWQNATEALIRDAAVFSGGAAARLGVASPTAMYLPLADLAAQAQSAAQSGWFGRKGRLAAVGAQLAPGLRPGAAVEPGDVVPLTTNLVVVQGEYQTLRNRAATIPGLALPPDWNPCTPEAAQVLQQAVAWLRWAGEQVAPNDRPTGKAVTALRNLLAAPQSADATQLGTLANLAAAFAELGRMLGTSPDDFRQWSGEAGLCRQWQVTAPQRQSHDTQLWSLRRWLDLRAHLLPLSRLGMQDTVGLLLDGRVDADQAVQSLELGLAVASSEERLVSTGLSGFDAEAHTRAIGRYQRNAEAIRELQRTALPAAAVSHRKVSVSATSGMVGKLRRELAKSRRALSVRGLFREYGPLITELMPCVLVSPDSLARFFPVEAGLFDLVVFDEASQIRVADAIGAIGRARSVVVVGDSKQMPPTSFAEPSVLAADEEFDEEPAELAVEDEESILTECVQARLPQHWLSWHYRSQDESLIAFSNEQYYKGKLSSFPSPTHGKADPGPNGFGINLVRVAGTFQRTGKGVQLRTNQEEAQAIVDEIQRRFAGAPSDEPPSLGVVTFNKQQRDCIEAMLRDLGDQHIVDALDRTDGEGLFVKNLENVQGDERDAVFFSTAFSVNDKGVLPLNFGPLNRGGGERRLNVAVTRARRQVVVFSSFDPAQLRAESTTSVGVKHLRAYLEAAVTGGVSLASTTARLGVIDRHREDVAEELRDRGMVVRTDIGLSDFRLDLQVALPSEPDRAVMAVLLDGPAWAARRTVGDRDAMPSEVLSKLLRWPAVERVWLPEWLDHRAKVADRLAARAEAAALVAASGRAVGVPTSDRVDGLGALIGEAVLGSSVLGSSVQDTVPTTDSDVGLGAQPNVDTGDQRVIAGSPVAAAESKAASAAPTPSLAGDATGRSSREQPFVPWDPGVLGTRDVLDRLPSDGQAASHVRAAVNAGIAAEGPIHAKRLARAVGVAFGLQSVAQSRVSSILTVAPSPDPDGFCWPPGTAPANWSGYRPDPAGQRPLEHISTVELANAMRALCVDTGGIERDELFKETLALFGMRRRTASATAVLQRVLQRAVRTHLVVEDAGYLRPGLDYRLS